MVHPAAAQLRHKLRQRRGALHAAVVGQRHVQAPLCRRRQAAQLGLHPGLACRRAGGCDDGGACLQEAPRHARPHNACNGTGRRSRLRLLWMHRRVVPRVLNMG